MTRLTDANELFSGKEPKFIGSVTELSKMDLIKSLNWYASNRTSKDAEDYAERYFKTKLKYTKPIKNIIPTFGFLCRIVTNGGILSEKDSKWFETQIEKIKSIKEKPLNITENSPTKPNIQDRIREKTNDCIAELEGMFDEYVDSKFKLVPIPYSILSSLEIKQTKDIIEHFKNRRKEYDEILTTSDIQLKEGYSNFSQLQIKKIIKFFDQIILDCLKLTNETKKTIVRKPRAIKKKTPEQILSKLNYCNEFTELNLKSVDPKSILGATQLWIYNTKYKKIGVYHAIDASGFSVLGTTLKNFDETKSVQKVIRNPSVTIPELLKATKVGLRTFMSKISTKENVLTGRIGSDTILLRVIK